VRRPPFRGLRSGPTRNSCLIRVARLRQVLQFQDGPALVVGHSYGGQVITALGADAPNVAGLVYIAAFGLDEGARID
jgi:pimeloyl-ACP methyl ester carboxylesterase